MGRLERIVAKSKPTLNLVSKTEASSSTVLSPNASNRPEIPRAPGQKGVILQESTGKPVAREPNQKDAASSSQVWQKDAEMDEGGRRPVATRTNQDLLNFRESSESTRRLVALTAETTESIDGNDTVWPHNLHISTAYVPHLEQVFSNARQKFGRKVEDKMEDLDVNTSRWGIFMTATLQAAVHLENDDVENLHCTKISLSGH